MRERIRQDLMRHACERIARIIADTNGLLGSHEEAITLAMDIHFYLYSTLIGTLMAHSPPGERNPAEFETVIAELQERYRAGKTHKQMMAAFLAGAMVRDIAAKVSEDKS